MKKEVYNYRFAHTLFVILDHYQNNEASLTSSFNRWFYRRSILIDCFKFWPNAFCCSVAKPNMKFVFINVERKRPVLPILQD